MDASRIAEALRKLDAQDFNPGDSFLASLVNNPAGLLTKWLPKQVNTAAGIPDQYDNPTPWLAPSVEDQIGAANNVAGIAQLGAFPTAPQVGKGTLGTMGGINAANAPKEKFTQAEQLAQALRLSDLPVGSDDWMNANRDIWGQTGIHYGADNMPRFEIDDSGALMRPLSEWGWGNREGFKKGEKAIGGLDEFMAHPQLDSNYSGFFDFGNDGRRMTMAVDPKAGSNGSFGDGSIRLGVIDDTPNKETAIHELQHAIQQREGFARGGSPEQFKNIKNLHGELLRQKNEISDDLGFDDWSFNFALNNPEKYQDLLNDGKYGLSLDPMYKEFAKSLADDDARYFLYKMGDFDKKIAEYEKLARYDPQEAYQRLAGEAEARAVQKRMSYTPEQRSQVFPLDDYDRAISDLIVRRGDGPNMSVGDNLNESLLQKYLTTGKLSPEEMAQYEANAAQMRDSKRQHLNVANADAQGGTAMDRAKGMGFDTDVLHGTSSDIKEVQTQPRRYVNPFYVTENNSDAAKNLANSFSETKPELGNPTIYPLKTKSSEIYDTRKDDVSYLSDIAKQEYSDLGLTSKGLPGWGQVNNWATGAKNSGIKSALIDERPDVNSIAIFDPSIIRSRFAAFDPLRKDSADLLASWLLPATMLGYGMYQPNNQSLAEALRGQ